MNRSETARLLAKAAAFDARTVGIADVAAWQEALADVELVAALDAITEHYRDQTERIMPAHVRRIVERNARSTSHTAYLASLNAPLCPHGNPGGLSINPKSGRHYCPLCRNEFVVNAAQADDGGSPPRISS
jgi:hypothetical protein